MSKEIWFCSDHHLGHANLLKFKGKNGHPGRTRFGSIEEHNEYIVHCHNSVVKPGDIVYMLGDVCWNSSSVKLLKQMTGNKTIIMGNHDKQKTNSYIGSVNELRGAMYFGRGINAIMTHIPVHNSQLNGTRFDYNIHGHMHTHKIADPRYLNVCMEQINYTPINLDEVVKRLSDQQREYEEQKYV